MWVLPLFQAPISKSADECYTVRSLRLRRSPVADAPSCGNRLLQRTMVVRYDGEILWQRPKNRREGAKSTGHEFRC
jgi:hypothetical protein